MEDDTTTTPPSNNTEEEEKEEEEEPIDTPPTCGEGEYLDPITNTCLPNPTPPDNTTSQPSE